MKKERQRNLIPAKLSIYGMFIFGFNLILINLCLEFKVTKIPKGFNSFGPCMTFILCIFFRVIKWTALPGPWWLPSVLTATSVSTARPWCSTPARPSEGTSGQVFNQRIQGINFPTFKDTEPDQQHHSKASAL